MSRKILSKKEKLLWNAAVQATLNEVYLYDGIIPDERDRLLIKQRVSEKLSYKTALKITKPNGR